MQKQRYNDETQFKNKLRQALRLSDVKTDAKISTPNINETHIQMCWELYQNARYNAHGKLLCGLMADLRDAKRALGGTNALHNGSVLNIVKQGDGTGWSTLANDCWVLGGIHAHMPFQLASNPYSEMVKHPSFVEGRTEESHMMRITARELIGLIHFGYRGCVNPNLDSKSKMLGVKYELRCFDKSKADEATIAGYLKVVRQQAKVMKNHGAMPVRKHISDALAGA